MAGVLTPQARGPAASGNGSRTKLRRSRARETGPQGLLAPGLLRSSEWLLLIYFFYAAIFSTYAGTRPAALAWRGGLALAGVAVFFLLARAESFTGSRFFSMVRDWLPAPLILAAYWAVDWFLPSVHAGRLEQSWIRLDRLVLDGWGARAAIESCGPLLPFLLELCYSLVYAVPPLAIGVFYFYRRRERVDRFLFTLLLGTLVTYVLLPHFPSLSPRVAFPGKDLPGVSSLFRSLNLWLLDNYDIRTSVFPSGHVTVAFSGAFAMLLALPEKRRAGWVLVVLASVVAIATVYGRYHYVVDVLAGLAVSLLASAASARLHPELQGAMIRRRDA